jgi:hypothetical protein
MDTQTMTVTELLAVARKGRPNVRYAPTKKGHAIGAWVPAYGRYVPVASLGIDGKWYSMPYELLINGKHPFVADDWDETA